MSGLLDHLVVVELGSARTEWCGKLFSEAGARVILVEPPGGLPMRRLTPFLRDDVDGDDSLHFWHYHTDKEGIVLDLRDSGDRDLLLDLIRKADIFLEGEPPRALDDLGLSYPTLRERNANLIQIAVSAFGQDGPWADYAATDLTHLALGGQMMMCGYDDAPATPPIAGGGGQAHHMAGTWGFIAALAALQVVETHGGQYLDMSVHDACAGMTELALPLYEFTGQVVSRRTGRHAGVHPTPPWQFQAGDGQYVNLQLVNIGPAQWGALVEWLDAAGMAEDLGDSMYYVPEFFQEQAFHINAVLRAFVATRTADEVFHEGQKRGLIFSKINYPEDLIGDEHLTAVGFFQQIEHEPPLGAVTYPGSAYVCRSAHLGPRRRAPGLDEHGQAIRAWVESREGRA